MNKNRVTLYTKTHCPLCDHAHILLQELQEDIPFQLETVDIYTNDELIERFGLMIPVVYVNGQEAGFGKLSKESVKKALTNFK